MKILPFLMLFIITAANAQYMPHTGQPFQLAAVYNPAFSGVENYTDITLSYRYQWTGFKENAPQFGNLLVNTRLKQPVDLRLNAPRSSVSSFDNVVPRRKLSITAAGLNVFSESVGPIRRVGGGLNYALHVPVARGVFLAGAGGAAIENTKLDMDEIYWGQGFDSQDPIYQSLANGASNHTALWVKTGALLHGERFYLGFAYYPWNGTLKSSDITFTDEFFKASLQGGISLALPDGSFIKPSVLGLIQTDNKILMDYHVKFYLEGKAWFGLSYRSVQSGIVSAGLNINEQFSLGYSYEFSLGKLRQFSGGSHDLVLGLRLDNFKQLNQWMW